MSLHTPVSFLVVFRALHPHSPRVLEQPSGGGIVHNVRTAISVALVLVGAVEVYAQRRGAFVPGPPYAGRSVAPAVSGTPGAMPWIPAPTPSAACCFGSGLNGSESRHSQDRDRGPEILAVPIPIPVGDESDPQPELSGNEESAQPAPSVPSPPVTVVLQAPAAQLTGNPAAGPMPSDDRRSAEVSPPDPPEPAHVFIALKDGWVYAATSYWVAGRTLHYITSEGDHNQVSLNLVDRKVSARLNQAAQISFVLP